LEKSRDRISAKTRDRKSQRTEKQFKGYGKPHHHSACRLEISAPVLTVPHLAQLDSTKFDIRLDRLGILLPHLLMLCNLVASDHLIKQESCRQFACIISQEIVVVI
jgi:hypothetical protein